MRLIHDVKGISKLFLLLLLLVSFIVGALLSYIWTMGFYASQEFHLPTQANVTIEKVEFNAGNATSFNVTVLNPSYSRSSIAIAQVWVSTSDGSLFNVTNIEPSLLPLAPGLSQTFKAYWSWGYYAGQAVNVIVLVEDGSGATLQQTTPFMNLTIASVNFDPTVSGTEFTVKVQYTGSQAFVNITRMTVNGLDVSASPTLPYTLETDSFKTFTLSRAWSDLQGKNATVGVETLQGFTAEKIQVVPEVLKISNILFDAANTTCFNLTVQNVATSQISLNISQVKAVVFGETVVIENVVPQLPYTLQSGSEVSLTCSWNWVSYQGLGTRAKITVYTQQDFFALAEASIP